MNDENRREAASEEDHLAAVVGNVMLGVILLILAMSFGAAGVMLAGGFLVLWAGSALLGRWIKRRESSK